MNTRHLDRPLDVNPKALTELSWVESNDQDISLETSLYVARLQTSLNPRLFQESLLFMVQIP